MNRFITDEEVLLASKILEDAVEWQHCDCGCPDQRSPASAKDAALLIIAAYIRVNLLSE